MLTWQVLFQSFFIGVSIAAVPGPLFFELTRRTLTHGFWSGTLVAFGAFIANALILAAVFFGMSGFLNQISIRSLFYIAGAGVLCYLAYSAFRVSVASIETDYTKPIKYGGSFVSGFLISFSSPIIFAFWISLSGSYLGKFGSPFADFLLIFLITFGAFLADSVFAFVVNATRHQIPTQWTVWLSRIFGAVLFAYGIYFIYELFKLLTGT